MNPHSRLLPDPELEEVGDRVTRALEAYSKRLLPSDLVALIDAPIESVLENVRVNIAADSVGIWLADESRENLEFVLVNPVDTRIIGPWMKRWPITHNNRHSRLYMEQKTQ